MEHSRKPNGWTGILYDGTGASLNIEPEEAIVFENAGIYIYHNDLYDTCTFYPIFTVRSIRWHTKRMEQKYRRNIGAKDLNNGVQPQMIDEGRALNAPSPE